MADNGRSDNELLAEFLNHRAPEPFEELVRRHGALVLGVCRRVLGHTPDADDALQATFLTLMAKAESLRNHESLAGWLYQAAWQIAQKARSAGAARLKHERHAGAQRPMTTKDDETWSELRNVLDQELNALPGNYRDVILLHHIEGMTLEETARALASNTGSISTWLHRGKELLRSRLLRRGMALSVGLLVALISERAAAEELSASAVKLVVGATASGAAVSPQVAALSKGALNAMFYAKMKVAATIALAVGIAGTGTGLAARRLLADEPRRPVLVKAVPDTNGPSETADDVKPDPDKADKNPAPDDKPFVKPPPDRNAPPYVKPPRDPNAPPYVKPPRDPDAPVVTKVKPPPDPNAPPYVKPPRDPNAPPYVKPPRDPDAPVVTKVKPPPDPNAPPYVKPPRDPNAPPYVKPPRDPNAPIVPKGKLPPDPNAPKHVKPGAPDKDDPPDPEVKKLDF